MRKISAMYQWSGGTSYKHKCSECSNLKRLSEKKCKCLIYGNTESHETDWKADYMACKVFDQNIVAKPVFVTGGQRNAE